MRTLLINPPYPFSEVPIIPMGLAYIAGVLEQNGVEVDVLDLLVSRHSKEKVKRKLEEYQPDIVGITSVTLNYPIASRILKHCKSVDGHIVAVAGGPHVTFRPAETLQEAPWIDIVVRGEGDLTMLDIATGPRLHDIDGITFRSDDGIRLTNERRLIEDLDALPLPARHLFPLSRYRALDAPCSLVTGRGCPFGCIFCVGSKMGGRKVRYRSPKLVVDEIEQCLAYGFSEVNLENDLFTLNHRHLHAICDEIMARRLRFRWRAFARVDTVNAEVLRKLKEAGCAELCYGVESGNQAILDRVKKKITLEQARNAVTMAREAGISVQAAFILGLPGETKETLARTIRFAQELGTFYGLHVLAPFPGTEVREKAEEYGIEILTDDWSRYDANRPVTRTQGTGPEDITAVLHRYYRGLRLTPDELAGIESDQPEIERAKRRSPLAWALLRGDVIAGLGRIRVNGDPVEDLANRLALIVPYPDHQVSSSVRRWAEEGLLRYDREDEYLAWRWAELDPTSASF